MRRGFLCNYGVLARPGIPDHTYRYGIEKVHSCLLVSANSRLGARRTGLELPQEPQIIFVKQRDVSDVITDHGDAFDAEAEPPAGPDFRVVAHVLEHLGMH